MPKASRPPSRLRTLKRVLRCRRIFSSCATPGIPLRGRVRNRPGAEPPCADRAVARYAPMVSGGPMTGRLPVVGIPCDYRMTGHHPFHMVGEKYITAVREGSSALPMLVPVLDPPLDISEILARVDGLLLTGSPSNVAPKRY